MSGRKNFYIKCTGAARHAFCWFKSSFDISKEAQPQKARSGNFAVPFSLGYLVEQNYNRRYLKIHWFIHYCLVFNGNSKLVNKRVEVHVRGESMSDRAHKTESRYILGVLYQNFWQAPPSILYRISPPPMRGEYEPFLLSQASSRLEWKQKEIQISSWSFLPRP